MLINEIRSECWYAFLIIIIIACGMLLCDIGNREAVWEEWYQNYEYNLDPQEGTGWIDSIVRPGNNP